MNGKTLARLSTALLAAGCLALAAGHASRRDASHAPEAPASEGPSLFGEGVISTPDDEFGGTFSPDGRTILYCKSVPRSQFYVIVESRRKNGRWSSPRVGSHHSAAVSRQFRLPSVRSSR